MIDKKNATEFVCLLCFGVVFSSCLVCLYVLGAAPIKRGQLGDSDCYVHLTRASELYHSPRWYNPVIARSNAPYGDELHWTRPFDILLLAGAVPLTVLTDFDTALFWWGVMVSPALLVATLVLLRWSARPLLGNDGSAIICFLLVMQVTILSDFQAGRPDHHSLLVTLFVLSVGLLFRLIRGPFTHRLCYAAAAVSAISMWVSIESLVAVALFSMAIGALWIWRDDDVLRKGVHFSSALAVLTFLILPIERPWHDLATREFDRLSIVHGVIFGLMAVAWIVLHALHARGKTLQRRQARFCVGVLAGVILAVLIGLLFPKFYGGPWVDVDPRIVPICMAHIGELSPLFSESYRWSFGVPALGYAAACAILFLRQPSYLKDPAWVFTLAATAVYAGLSAYQVRWTSYLQILLLIPVGALIMRMRKQSAKGGVALGRMFVNVAVTGGFVFIAISGSLIEHLVSPKKPAGSALAQSATPMCEYLVTNERWQGRPLRIVTHLNFAGEILYRTPHEIVGALYHRNWRGILDTHAILTADTDQAALKLLAERRVDLILLCPAAAEAQSYEPDGATTFYGRLTKGQAPPWCRKVELPTNLSSFLLFAVKGQPDRSTE